MPRFFCPSLPSEGVGAEDWPLPEQAARHARVLRLRVGDALVLFDGMGGEVPAVVTAIDRREVRVQAGTRRAIERERPARISVAVGLIAADRMDWLVQKATELGVHAIEPLLTERSQRLPGDAARRLAHWRAIAVAACEQSGRNRLPTLAAPQPFAAWLAVAAAESRYLVLADPGGAAWPAVGAQAERTLVVGPEGGFSAEEWRQLGALAPDRLALGPAVLRTETAVIAGLALIAGQAS